MLARLANGGAAPLDCYVAAGGYQALRKALAISPAEIVAEMDAAQLRGRGGAGFPIGKKWRAVMSQQSAEKVIVANADEGDPGAYIDRFLLEGDPHSIIEAMAVGAYAVGAQRGYIYLRKEYPAAALQVRQALEDARTHAFLGAHVLGSAFSFDIELVIGEGSYVCGEETCLLNAIEGKRPQARMRPPYPTDSGLWGAPTLVTNVETLANFPWIVLHGGAAYQRLGFSKSRGTKAVSLNSLFSETGIVRGGIRRSRSLHCRRNGRRVGDRQLARRDAGRSAGGVIPPDLLDTPLGFEELWAIGATVGHGGMIAFDEHTSIRDLMRHVFEFGAFESCGKCTPCRLGTRRIVELLGASSPDRSSSLMPSWKRCVPPACAAWEAAWLRLPPAFCATTTRSWLHASDNRER